jgi:TolA-binding protein
VSKNQLFEGGAALALLLLTPPAWAYHKVEGADFEKRYLACESLHRDRAKSDRLPLASACLRPLVAEAKAERTQAELSYRLAEWREEAGDAALARESFLSLAHRFPRQRLAARARFRAARLLEDALDDVPGALQEYERLVREAPDNSAAINALIHVEDLLGPPRSLDFLVAELNARPRSPLSGVLMARLGHELMASPGGSDKAASVFDELAHQASFVHKADALFYAGKAYLAAGRPAEAVARFEQVCASEETVPFVGGSASTSHLDDSRLLIAEIYRDTLRDEKRARFHFEKLVHDYPDSRLVDDALVALAHLAAKGGDRKRAAAYYAELVSARPDSRFVAEAQAFQP